MRKVLCGTMATTLMLCAFSVPSAATVHRKKSTSKSAAKGTPAAGTKSASKTAPSSSGSANRSAAATTASKRTGKKAAPVSRTTWRNRQLAPTSDRYLEIQQALATKGYLKPEDATGGWTQNSVDALKKFQADQNIDASGKINSLSLIALGLGPKRDSATSKPVTESTQTDR